MKQRILHRESATSSEEAVFDEVLAAPACRVYYLSLDSGPGSADAVYRDLWASRSMLSRLLEQRQANARAAVGDVGSKLEEIRRLRRQLDGLLQNAQRTQQDRDRLLTETMEPRDRLEREVVASIPALKRWQELDTLGPEALVKALPLGTVFIDIVRFTRLNYTEGKDKRTPSCVAFVLTKDRPIQRIELGEAKRIEDALYRWRTAVDTRQEDVESAAALQQLLWSKLFRGVASEATTVYFAIDGELARLPWAALPIGNGQVLLDKYEVAHVPHGAFLLDHMTTGMGRSGDGSLVVLGVSIMAPVPGRSCTVQAWKRPPSLRWLPGGRRC